MRHSPDEEPPIAEFAMPTVPTVLIEMSPGDDGEEEMANLLKEIRCDPILHLKVSEMHGVICLMVTIYPTDEDSARIREVIEGIKNEYDNEEED